MSGTSMAAPHVTGALAVLKSKDKKATSEEIKQIILSSTNQQGNKSEFDYGVINLQKAIGVSTGNIEPNKPIEEPVVIPTPDPGSETDKPEEPVDPTKPTEGAENEEEYYKKYHEKPLNTDENGNPLPSLPDVTILQANIPPAPEPQFNPDDVTVFDNNNKIDNSLESIESSALSDNNLEENNPVESEPSKTESSVDSTLNNEELPVDLTLNSDESSVDQMLTNADTLVNEDDISLLSTTSGSGGSISDNIVSSTSINITLTFPANSYNKQMKYYDYGKGVWTNFYYNGSQYFSNNTYSGTYTVTGLTPYSTYIFQTWCTIGSGSTWYPVEHKVTMPLPPEVLVSSSTQNLTFSMEQIDISQFSNYTNWKNRIQTVYSDMKELTGYTPSGRDFREIKTTRTQIPNYWALSGDPILLNRTYTPDMISRINSRGDWSFGVAHELGHEFDNYKWNFDSEFWANFKTYYTVEKNNATVHVGYSDYYTGGAALKNYFKSISNANGGSMSYDNSLAKGTYAHDGLTYKFIDIKDKIGWEPFRKTFRFFNSLNYTEVPTKNIDKFNLFISLLTEYSGKDVFSMLTSQEKSGIEAKFGGKIRNVIQELKFNTPTSVSSDYVIFKFIPPTTGKYMLVNTDGNAVRGGLFTGFSRIAELANYFFNFLAGVSLNDTDTLNTQQSLTGGVAYLTTRENITVYGIFDTYTYTNEVTYENMSFNTLITSTMKNEGVKYYLAKPTQTDYYPVFMSDDGNSENDNFKVRIRQFGVAPTVYDQELFLNSSNTKQSFPYFKTGAKYWIEVYSAPNTNYSMRFDTSPGKNNLVFSAFSMGSDLYDSGIDLKNISTFLVHDYHDQSQISLTPDKVEIAKKLLTNKVNEGYSPLNPAEYFANKMKSINLSQYTLKLNYDKTLSNRPRKSNILTAMKYSDVVYLATHGESIGLWIQDIVTDANGMPKLQLHEKTLSNGEVQQTIDFRAKDAETALNPTYFNGSSTGMLSWLVIAGCSQLNSGDLSLNWASALLRNNNAHGILGYWGSAPGGTTQNRIANDFASELNAGKTFITAWKNANEGLFSLMGNSRWAVVYNGVNKYDKISSLTKNDSQTGNNRRIFRLAFVDKFERDELTVLSSAFVNKTMNKELIQSYLLGEASANSINGENGHILQFNSDSSFEFENLNYSVETSMPIAISEEESAEQAINALNSMGLTPTEYNLKVSAVVETELLPTGTTGIENVLEYNVLLTPIDSIYLSDKENDCISINISVDGIEKIDYNWN